MLLLCRNVPRILNYMINNIFTKGMVIAQQSEAPNICRPRFINTSRTLLHGEFEWQEPKSEDDVVNVTFIDKDGNKISIRGKVGDNLMYLAHRHEIPMEGACEASLACTTCHCYIEGNYSSKLPTAEEKEDDLLDLAPFLKENSRLGCQIILNKDLEGMEVRLPKATRNFYVDGHTPKPH